MSAPLSEEAQELLDAVDEACDTANDNLTRDELKAFSAQLQEMVTRWRKKFQQ